MDSDYVSFSRDNPFGTQAKMASHIDRLHEYLTTGDTWPILAEVNPTNRCNLRCKWCISENMRSNEELDSNALVRFMVGFAQNGGRAITLSGGGEPTLYSHLSVIPSTVRSLRDDGHTMRMGLMTNGAWKSKETTKHIGSWFDWVRVSVDTTDRDAYVAWKGVDLLPQVLCNIDELRDYPVRVGANCNVNANMTIDQAIGMINDLIDRVDYIQFRPVIHRLYHKEKPLINEPVWVWLSQHAQGNPKINLSNDKLSDIVNGRYFQFRSCVGHHFQTVLNANGDLCACMYRTSVPAMVFGNINENSYYDIWTGEKRAAALDYIYKMDCAAGCQPLCKNTELNKLLDYLLHPEEIADRDFL